jgi:hypothetical protein
MDNLKKHTITCLVLIFLVAQGMDSLHFYLFHQDIEELNTTEDRVAISTPNPHQCDFHYFKTPLTLNNFLSQDYRISILPTPSNSFTYNKLTIKKFKQTKYLRGPPEILL